MDRVHLRSLSAVSVSIVLLVLLTVCNWTGIHDQFLYTLSSMQERHASGPTDRYGEQAETPEEVTRYVKHAETPQQLIEILKNLTKTIAAGTTDGPDISANELKAWNMDNPCFSRWELIPMYDQRTSAKRLAANPLWNEVFAQYARYHRVCTKSIRDPKAYIHSRSTRSACKFLIADVAGGTGIGNKLFTLASAILYAIINQRVLLVPSSNLVTDYTCEPFPGSSWRLDPQAFPTPTEQFVKDGTWILDRKFFHRIDERMGREPRVNYTDYKRGPPLAYAVGVTKHEWQPTGRFYCTTEQRAYMETTWIYMSGCIYTIPKLFAVPLFRPLLEGLFPDRMAMTRILRSVLLPDNTVWDRVMTIHHVYLSGADHQVGLQVRYLNGIEQYKKMNDVVNARIISCTQQNGLLPRLKSELNSKQLGDTNSSVSNPMVKVFIASLFSGLQESLSKVYVQNASISGEDVGLVQITQDETQGFSLDEDRQAFTEVILLSLSDHLMVTPMSTFGGLAQAFGALTPWFIDYRENVANPCERSPTVDVCNQYSDKAYTCPHDLDVDGRRFDELTPYIKDCLAVDHELGIHLITEFES